MFGCLYGAAPGPGRNPFSSGFGLLGSMLTSVRRECGPNFNQRAVGLVVVAFGLDSAGTGFDSHPDLSDFF